MANRRFEAIRANPFRIMKIGVFLRINSRESPRFVLRIAGPSKMIIDLLMGLFRGAVFRHGWGALKQPIKQPTETPTSTLALMGRFPSLMGRFPTLMGRFAVNVQRIFVVSPTEKERKHTFVQVQMEYGFECFQVRFGLVVSTVWIGSEYGFVILVDECASESHTQNSTRTAFYWKLTEFPSADLLANSFRRVSKHGF